MGTRIVRRKMSALVAGGKAHGRAAGLAGVVRAVETPAFVIDERVLLDTARAGAELARACGVDLLYAPKPLPDALVLSRLSPWLDGFSASSTLEARLARSVLGESGVVHVTSPGISGRDVDELGVLCDRVALDSLSQLRRPGPSLRRPGQLGLRINPQLSMVDDERYDPCRRHSKAGRAARRPAGGPGARLATAADPRRAGHDHLAAEPRSGVRAGKRPPPACVDRVIVLQSFVSGHLFASRTSRAVPGSGGDRRAGEGSMGRSLG